MARSRVLVCGTTPITCLASAGWRTMSTPPTMAEPLVGITRVVSMPMVVDLPAPFGPEEAVDLAAADLHVEVDHGVDVARVDLVELLGGDDRRRVVGHGRWTPATMVQDARVSFGGLERGGRGAW